MRQMKDSGIAWIGQIPQNLEVIKNRYLITYVKGKNPNNLNNEGFGFPYVGASDLDSENYSIYTTDSSLPSVDSTDVLILWDGARAGLVGTEKIGKLSSTVVKLQFAEKINSRYFYWYLLGMNSFIISCVNGTTIPHMHRKYIDDVGFITFSLPEQQAIADKLDKVCGEIDKVIAKTKAVVEEYKKLKQAIITEAVTGKRQCVMRNSQCGIKEKWAEIKLKWVVSLKIEKAENNINYVGLENIESGSAKFVLSENKFFEAEGETLIAKEGQVLFGKLRPYLAKCYVVEKDCTCSTEFLVMQPTKIDKHFLKYILLSFDFIDYVDKKTYGVKMPRANWDIVGSYVLALPPLPEQQAIVAYLDTKCGAIDEVIAKKQQLITEMENYKKSVIYEYVTGKKEVG